MKTPAEWEALWRERMCPEDYRQGPWHSFADAVRDIQAETLVAAARECIRRQRTFSNFARRSTIHDGREASLPQMCADTAEACARDILALGAK